MWHAETKGSIVASFQLGACSLSYPVSHVHLRSDAVGADGWRNFFSRLFLVSAFIAHDLPWQIFYITPAFVFICMHDLIANTVLSTLQID